MSTQILYSPAWQAKYTIVYGLFSKRIDRAWKNKLNKQLFVQHVLSTNYNLPEEYVYDYMFKTIDSTNLGQKFDFQASLEVRGSFLMKSIDRAQ